MNASGAAPASADSIIDPLPNHNGQAMHRANNYSELLHRYGALAGADGVRLVRYNLLERGLDLVKLELASSDNPRYTVAMYSGTHGDEPAPVHAVLQFLEDGRWRAWPEVHFKVMPCVNPTGFDLGTRENVDGKDVNRTFKLGDSPESRVGIEMIGTEPLDMWIDAHEDPVEDGFYCFSQLPNAWSDALVDAVGQHGPIFAKPEVDEMPVSRGVVFRSEDEDDADVPEDVSEYMRERENWPLPFYVMVNLARLGVTLETPGVIDLEARIRMQLAGFDVLLDLLTGRLKTP